MRRWYQKALPIIGTKIKSWDVTWKDFRYDWRRIRCPQGCGGYLDAVLKRAKDEPPTAEALQINESETRLLIALCARFKNLPEPVHSICHADQPGVCVDSRIKMTAWRRLNALVDKGIVELVKVGSGGTTQRNASEFRYPAVLAGLIGEKSSYLAGAKDKAARGEGVKWRKMSRKNRGSRCISPLNS